MSQNKVTTNIEYLGDGVYAIFDDFGGIWLHANDHENPTDKIYLEPSVLKALNNFNEKCIKILKDIKFLEGGKAIFTVSNPQNIHYT